MWITYAAILPVNWAVEVDIARAIWICDLTVCSLTALATAMFPLLTFANAAAIEVAAAWATASATAVMMTLPLRARGSCNVADLKWSLPQPETYAVCVYLEYKYICLIQTLPVGPPYRFPLYYIEVQLIICCYHGVLLGSKILRFVFKADPCQVSNLFIYFFNVGGSRGIEDLALQPGRQLQRWSCWQLSRLLERQNRQQPWQAGLLAPANTSRVIHIPAECILENNFVQVESFLKNMYTNMIINVYKQLFCKLWTCI